VFTLPNQPNKGLGYRLCPDGNQKEEYDVIMEKLRRISKLTSLAYLTASETNNEATALPKIDASTGLRSLVDVVHQETM